MLDGIQKELTGIFYFDKITKINPFCGNEINTTNRQNKKGTV
jgi:hypothetical protein